MNAVEIEEAVSKLVEEPFDRDNFPFAFLQAFGTNDATLRKLKSGEANKSDVPGAALQRSKNNIHLAGCAPGEVAGALAALRQSPATAKLKARFILATDGQTLQAERFDDGEVLACDFRDLPNRFTFFLPLAGISTVKRIDENAFDIRATARLNKLYVELLKENPDWDTDARRQDFNHFFARLIFCFFAEDTGIFDNSRLFTGTIEQMTVRDGSNVHEVLGTLFEAMNTPAEKRADADLPASALRFPYVNGNLFGGAIANPRFNQAARNYLLFVGNLDWKLINPDIFGSMIQAVADDEERGALGMHYTSVPNILKVLNPLFLDDLRQKLAKTGDGATPASESHGRLPQHGEDRDIFERLYAVRLDRLRQSPEYRAVLKDHDPRGLLIAGTNAADAALDEPDDTALQAALRDLAAEDDDVTRLVHVRPREDRKAAEEVAQRTPCADFEKFRPIFDQVQKELDVKIRQAVPFEYEGAFEKGDLFILDGQKAYVAAVGDRIMRDFGREDGRLRVIFDNGTESKMLLRSLQRALYKVEHSRRIILPVEDPAPLFAVTEEEGDQHSGHIYVLRSKSDHPFFKKNRNVLHKIGVTSVDVKARIGNAKRAPTFLLADVEIVAEYKLANVNRKGLEALLHKVFAAARLDVQLKDRFGSQVEPREWFLVPLAAIDEAIERVRDGSIDRYRYDPTAVRFIAD